MNSDYMVPIKTGYRGKTLNVSHVQYSQEFNNDKLIIPNRRICIGGRGREWVPMAYKVLQEMSKNEDINVLMQPVNAVKHPEYYTMVSDPVDLSKIQLKFHSGCYTSINKFIEDVHFMFTNYFLIYQDANSPIHKSLQQAKEMFDEEMEKIKQQCGLNKSYNRFSFPKSIGERIDAIEAENRNILGVPFIIPSSASSSSSSLVSSSFLNSSGSVPPQQVVVKYPINGINPQTINTSKSQQIVLKKVAPSFGTNNTTTISNADHVSVSRPLYTVRLTSNASKIVSSHVATGTTVVSSSNNTPNAKQLLILPKRTKPTCEPYVFLQSNNGHNNVSINPNNHFSSIINKNINNNNNNNSRRATKAPEATPNDEVALVINATNVWFGSARTSPIKPIIANDMGFFITCQNNFLKKGGGSKSTRNLSNRDLVHFLIKPDDIIKCCAYLGSQRKHTIFLFLLPNCIRSLKQKINFMEASPGIRESFCDSSLIAIFTPSLNRSEMSQLVYLMWCFGRGSIFGPTIYSEIDQKSALSLLSNIKPALLTSKCLLENNESSLSSSSSSHLLSTVKSPPIMGQISSSLSLTALPSSSSQNNRFQILTSVDSSHDNNNTTSIAATNLCSIDYNNVNHDEELKHDVARCPAVVGKMDFEYMLNGDGGPNHDGTNNHHSEEDEEDEDEDMQIEEITLNDVELKQEPNDGFNDDELVEINNLNNNFNNNNNDNFNNINGNNHNNNNNLNSNSNYSHNEFDNDVSIRHGNGDVEDEEEEEETSKNKRHKMRRKPGILSRRGSKRKVSNEVADTKNTNRNNNNNNNTTPAITTDTQNNDDGCRKEPKQKKCRNVNNDGKNTDVNVSGCADDRGDDEGPEIEDNSSENNNYTVICWPPNDNNNSGTNTKSNGNNNDEEEEDDDDAETNDISTNGGDETEDAFSNESDACDLEIVMPVESDSEVDYVKAATDELLSLREEARGDVMVMGGRPPTKCPITQSTMVEPVRNKLCGHSYDRKGVQQLINMRGKKAKCPVPGCANLVPLDADHLEDDEQIKLLLNIS